MIKKEMEAGEIERRVHDLANAMSKIRSDHADRDDVVVEMKNTKLSRLELLYEDLQFVIEDIPKECDQFDFAVSRGETPRLWVDMTSFVRMGSDGRDYEFVKDTRMGRVVLGRGSSRKKIGEHITSYIAERLLERERMIEGDWYSMAHMIEAYSAKSEEKSEISEIEPKPVAQAITQQASTSSDMTMHSTVSKAQHSTLSLITWFVLGLLGGAGILFILVWFGMMEQIVQMVR